MAAPLGKPPDKIKRDVVPLLQEKDVDSFSFIVDHVIGDRKLKTNVFLPNMFGPNQMRTNQELMVTGVMESCAFKAVLSCVAGMLFLFIIFLCTQIVDILYQNLFSLFEN